MTCAFSIPPEGVQEWQMAYELWRHPSAPRSTTLRYYTPSVHPIDCLMPNPRPGDVNRVSRTSGWREGVTTPTLSRLVPVPGCLLGSEPTTCPRTQPAGRKFTPASTSETGRKSSAGPETPPLELPTTSCDVHHAGSKHAYVNSSRHSKR